MQKQKNWQRTFQPPSPKIKSLTNSLNGKFLLLSLEQTLQVLCSKTGKTLNHLPTSHKKPITQIKISKYGNYFLTISSDNKVILWDGSELSPQKKFSLSPKSTKINFAGFNDNETTAYIVTNREIAIFKIKGGVEEKELRKVKVKDREIEGAGFVESLGVLVCADSLNFIGIYDVVSLERVNLTQKLNCVNFVKVFGDRIWVVFSNNCVAVYRVEDTEIKFDVFEKKTPFEILDVEMVNEDVFLAAGFSDRIVLLNGEGCFLRDLAVLENSTIIRRFAYHRETAVLTVAEDFYNIVSFKIHERPRIYIKQNLWIKIKNLGQLDLSLYEEENPGNQGSYKNYTIDIQGYVQSIGYNENSYLAVLSKNSKNQKIRLFESQMILKNIEEFEFDNLDDDLEDFEKLFSEKKKNMIIDFFEAPEKVFCTITYLIFKLKKSIILTDFNLNILKSWNFNYLINFVNVYSCLKRKESAIVCLENGEVIKINFDNPFPVTILDYKLSIKYFELNKKREKFMIIDKNYNFSLYNYNPETLSTTQIQTIPSISSSGFNKSNPDLFYTLSLNNILTIKHKTDNFLTLHNFLNPETEKILIFQKTQILLKNLKNNYVRLVEISLNQITSELIKNKKYKESLNLLLSVDSQNNQQFTKLAISAFSDLSPFAIEAIKNTNDGQLLHLAEEVFKNQKNKENLDVEIEKIKIKSEMLNYEGKFNSAVELLLNEKQILQSLEMLIVLGKYDRAIKILKNPIYKRNLKSGKYNINSLIKLQAIYARDNNEENLALELFKSIKENEEVVKILIKKKKDQDLINFLRMVDLDKTGKKGINLSINYFKNKNNITYAKECLIKLDKKVELLDLYIETEMFENGLKLFEQLRKEKILEPERIYIPYAAFLMRENRFEEALENYKKIEKLDLCLKMLKKFVKINLYVRNYLLVSVFLFEGLKLKNCEAFFDLECFFFLFLRQFCVFKESFGIKEFRFLFLRNVFCLVLNLIGDIGVEFEIEFLNDANFVIQKCYEEKFFGFAVFFIEKLKILDSKGEFMAKWNFVKNVCLKKKNNLQKINPEVDDKENYLYKCYNCDNKGFKCTKMSCSECGLKLFFCSFSGKQIPIFEIIFENNIKSELYLSLENFKNFNMKKNENENFMKNLLKKNYEYQRNKGMLLIDSENVIKRIDFENFIEFEENKFYYKYGKEDILICENCGIFWDLDVLEEFSKDDCCLICKKNEFSTY